MLGITEFNGCPAHGTDGLLQSFGLQNGAADVALVASCGGAAFRTDARHEAVGKEGITACAISLGCLLFINIFTFI